MIPLTLFLFASVFDGEDYQDIGISPYAETSENLAQPNGIEISARRLIETQNESTSPTGEEANLRFWRDENGEIRLDAFELRSLLVAIRSRPMLGEDFDIGLLVGSWNEVVAHGQSNHAQWLVYTPIAVHLLGFARNDMDEDDRLKYYIGGSTGLGGEATMRLLGPTGFHARGETRLTSKNRWRSNDVNTTRHEVEIEMDLGVSWIRKNHQWMASVWGERLWRWEPRDEDPGDGVDLQHDATGFRLTMRRYKPGISLEPDLDAVLNRLRKDIVTSDPTADTEHLTPSPPVELDPEAGSVLSGTEGSENPILVHWSEPEVLQQSLPVLPEGMSEEEAVCKLRFFVDSTGQPYEIEAEECSPPLLGPAMASAWQWRLVPFSERGEIHPIQFLYSVRWQKSPGAP